MDVVCVCQLAKVAVPAQQGTVSICICLLGMQILCKTTDRRLLCDFILHFKC